ncbi:pilus assembly PilX N-terminal domain-containing protein [Ureibacillus manganicus]|uniref:Type 4 fimbrial biogenesis protein PilX N-terminal domain-containing protein n=1 Tax=Ureibacillus manganicus DSM 26584 TaxID=1384049 RepID=A0A0A3I4B9_9BACL|nr:pilus assembly PilX N-terminal domain-containing protein [Ureibacillus manganicus]KGR79651.1 hypothetical protein CD29_06015 [Ureibacillus manganicus DSM 26584]
MKKLNNDHGMALVMVLLIIVVFTIIGLLLMNLTFSTSKQVTITEENMQAEDIAEMGIIYMENVLISNAQTVLQPAINKVIANIAVENINKVANGEKEIPYTTDEILSRLNISVDNDGLLKGIPIKHQIGGQSDIHFEIVDVVSAYVNNKIIINFESKGTIDNNSHSISGTFELELNRVLDRALTPSTPNIPGTGGNSISDILGININALISNAQPKNTISEPSPPSVRIENQINYTGSIDGNEFINKDLYSNTYIQFKEIYNGLKNTNFYAKYGDMSVSNQLSGGINNTSLYSGTSIEMKKIYDGITNNSILYSKGTISSDNELSGGISNSKLYSFSDMTFKSFNGGIKEDSLLYSDKNLTIDNIFNGGINNSKLFTKENMTFSNHFNNGIINSTLYSKKDMKFGNQFSDGISDNSFLISEGNLIFENHFYNGIKNSTLYSKKDMIFGNQFSNGISDDSFLISEGNLVFDNHFYNGINNSTLYSKKDMKFNGQFTNGINNKSFLYVNGDLLFDNHFYNGINNSKIYVHGDATFKKGNVNVSNDSLVCVEGNISGLTENGINVISKLVHQNDFEQKCSQLTIDEGTSSTPSPSKPATLDNLLPSIEAVRDFEVIYK